MNKLVELAEEIATKAHSGQTDKAGVAYIEHPKYVAALLNKEDEKIVALLHDVLEDSDVTARVLYSLFPSHIVDAVKALTKMNHETYNEYIDRVKQNPLSKVVKMADLRHNMMLERLSPPTNSDYQRVKRYKQAYDILAG